MARFVLAFMLLLHGLIHSLGFVKEFQLASVGQLSGKTGVPLSANTARLVGIGWLLAGLLFVASAAVCLKKDGWWMLASVSIVLSQALIILYWQDAKFGTLANGIILVAIILAYGHWDFYGQVQKERQRFLSISTTEKNVVTSDRLIRLPASVQKWLHRSHIVGKEMIDRVHLKQKGEMRTKPDSNWMPVEAEQYFTVDKPGFLWIADVQAAPLIHLAGRDKYEEGRGEMLIKLLSLFPVAYAKGKEIDQGALLRYLAETMWFPSAALSPYISWQEIDSTQAKATMSYQGVTASGIFGFNPEGDVISFEAQRYYYRKEGATLENWFIAVDSESYQSFEGIRIPTKAVVTWKLKTGDFTWYRLEVTHATYHETGQTPYH